MWRVYAGRTAKKLRRPALHSLILHCGTKSARIARPNNFNKVPFQSTKERKKKLSVDNIKTNGDVFCPTCRNEKCVYISTNQTTNFNNCKKCKACCNVLNIPFKDQKLTIILFGGDGTHCWGIPYLITLLSNSQILIHCWAIPNPESC